MAISIANVNQTTDTFLDWLDKTNQVLDNLSTKIITTEANTTGGVTSGNAVVNGTFSANVFSVVTGIRGGSVASPGVLNITSNAAFVNATSNVFVLTTNTTTSTIVSNVATININSTNTNFNTGVLTISANVDNITTAITNGNIVVKDSAVFTTPNIGAATGISLSVTGNLTANNLSLTTSLSGNIANFAGNVSAGNLTSLGIVSASGNVSGGNLYIANESNLAGNLHALGNSHFGQPLTFAASGANIQYAGTANSYLQLIVQNKDNGAAASTDFVATADNGTDNDTYIDMGINSSAYNQAGYELTGPNDGYLYVYGNTTIGGGNLVLATYTQKDILFATGGLGSNNLAAKFQHGNGLSVTGNVYAPWFIGNVGGNASNIIVAGPNTGVVFNDDGQANSTSGFTFDKSSNSVNIVGNLTANNITATNNFYGNNLSLTGTLSSGNLDISGSNISTSGNITANYFFGNGYYLTGVITSVSNIFNGNSNVRIDTAGGNIAANVSGTANVLVLANTGAYVNGEVSASGNVTGNFILGNGYYLTGVSATTDKIFNGTSNVRIDTANGNILANVNGTANVLVLANTGLYTTGVVSAAGNVSGNYIFGDGSGLTNLPAPTVTQDLSETGLVSIMLYDGNIKYNNYATVQPSSGNIAGGNLLTGGVISAAGNITGNYILGNGAFLTGVITSVANINNGTSNIRIETSGGNIFANVGGVSNVFAITTEGINLGATSNSNITSTASNISITAPAGKYVSLNSDNLSQLYWTSNIANVDPNSGNDDYNWVYVSSGGIFLETNLAGNSYLFAFYDTGEASFDGPLSVFGNITGGENLSTLGDGFIGGNLTVNGNTTYVNVQNLNVEDPIIGLGRGANNAPLTSNDAKDRGSQLWYYAGAEKSAFVGYDNSDGKLLAATNVTITNEIVTVNNLGNIVLGNIEGSYIIANSNITGANIFTAGNVSATGNVTGNFVLGNGYYLTGVTAVAFSAANVLGNVNQANANGRANLLASSNTTISINAGNGIQIDPYTGNTTIVVSVIGSLNDGTLWGGGGSAGNVVDAANIILDDGSVANAATLEYDLGNSLFPSACYVIVDTVPPALPHVGDIWIDTNTGIQYLYFNDGTSSQWVEMTAINTVNSLTTPMSFLPSNIIPSINNTYSLGNASNQWANLFVAGNITSGNIIGNGVISSSGNITAGGTLSAGSFNISNLTVSTLSASGNITGSYFLGNGSQLTGITASGFSTAKGIIFSYVFGG